MTTTPYKYPLEERKMHQSSGYQETYKEARIYSRLRYPFQATDFFHLEAHLRNNIALSLNKEVQ